MRRQLIVAACVCVGALAFGAGLAQAKVVHLNGQAYGITYPPGHGATVTPGDVPSPFAPTIGSPTQPRMSRDATRVKRLPGSTGTPTPTGHSTR